MRLQTIIAVVASISTAASAQDANPYGGGSRLVEPQRIEVPGGSMSLEDKARIVTLGLADCLLKDHRSSVLKAITVDPWESNADRMLSGVVNGRCCLDMGGELRVPNGLFRGAFYQVLYRESFQSGPPALPATAIDFGARSGGDTSPEARTDIALRQFGDCVARRDIKDAHALILSRPGSTEETTAVTGLMPHFSACLVQGSKWTLNRSSVAAVLSEVVYREGLAAEEPEASRSQSGH